MIRLAISLAFIVVLLAALMAGGFACVFKEWSGNEEGVQ